MHRRELLRSLGFGFSLAAVLPLTSIGAAPADPLEKLHRDFAAARKRHTLLAGWESVAEPGTSTVLAKILGKWPKTLSGRLFRNGPGLWDRGEQRYRHWFDGDGLIQRWSVDQGRVQHRAQFVQTPKLREEHQAGQFVVPAAGTTINQARSISGPDDLNTANTAVLAHAGKLYALWEAGSAFEIDADSMQTIGAKSWSTELEQVPFSAHPLHDANGEVWNYGHLGRNLVIYRIGADGQLRDHAVHELPRGGYMHSFAMTPTRLVFMLAPLVMEELRGSFFESMQWRPQLGSLAIVIDKSAPSAAPRMIELDAGIAYHYADARDDKNGGIVLRACWYEDGETAISPLAALMRGAVDAPGALNARLACLHLPADGGRGRIEYSELKDVEFPVVTDAQTLLMLQSSAAAPHGMMDTLLSVDARSQARHQYRMPSSMLLEEALPVVAADDRRYVIGTVFNSRKPATGLLLFDASHIDEGPIAEAWLERAMPLGFHGAWMSS